MSNNCVDTIEYSSKVQALPKHFHVGMEFIYIVEGKMELTVKGQTWEVGKNTLVLLSHLVEHSIRVLEEPYTRYFLILNSYDTGRLLGDPSLLLILRGSPTQMYHLDESQREEAHWIFQRLKKEKERADSFSGGLMDALVKSLFIFVYRLQNASAPPVVTPGAAAVTQVQNYIDEHFSEPMKISELAEQFFMSKFYLSHLFKGTTGYTVKEYLTLTRLTHARKLLTTTNMKINEICFESGFNDVNSFIRSFRQEYNCTPFVYRKQARAAK